MNLLSSMNIYVYIYMYSCSLYNLLLSCHVSDNRQCPIWCQSPGEKWKKQMDHQHQNWKKWRWQFQRQWMSKWKMTREEIIQTMIKWKRKKTGRTLIKRQTTNKKRKAWKGFKMLQADPPRSIACICLLFLQRDCPQVMKWEPKFSRNIRHLGMFFFCCALLHCQRMLISNEIQWKKNCHQDSAGEAFEFSWTNKLCLGAWLRFRYWTAFNPMFFRPSWKLRLDLLG